LIGNWPEIHVIVFRHVAGSLLTVMVLAPQALASPSELAPGTEHTVELPAGSMQEFRVSLPDGMAADIDMTQRAGFVDIELQGGKPGVNVRTESGTRGRIEAPLLGSQSTQWRVEVMPRKDKGSGTVELRLSPLRRATRADQLRFSAFAHYTEADRLRFENFRETAVTSRPVEVTDRTRGAYEMAMKQYSAAADGCGMRRAQIGLSRLLVALEQYSAARSAAQSALGSECAGDLAEQAQALKTLGMAAAYQGDFNAAADADERALALYRRTGDLRYQGIVLGNLSAVYMQLGETDRALAAATGALMAAEETADGQGIVFSRKSIGDIHLARGELAGALREYRGTLSTLAATPYPMIEAETWNDLGIVYHRMADYQESLKAYATAAATWKKMGSRAGEADTLIDTSQTLLELGDRRSATRELDAALEIARADGLKSPQTRALRGLGLAALADNRVADARAYLSRSLHLARATGEIAAESYALRAISDVDMRQGSTTAARRDAEAALRLARQAADRDGEASTLAQLARAVADDGDLAEARRLIDRALAIIERQRGQIDDPSLRTSYFASVRAFPDTQIDLLMRLDGEFPSAGYAMQALAAAERARARSLQDMFAERSITVDRSLTPELAESLRSAEEGLRTAALQLDRPSAHANTSRSLRIDAFDAASHTLDEIRGQVRSSNPRYADLTQPLLPTVATIQQTLLDDDAAVLEYWLGPRESYVWIVTRHEFRAVRLPPRADIERLAAELGDLLRTPPAAAGPHGFEELPAAEARAAAGLESAEAGLGRILIGPRVLTGLPRKIAIVADGGLQRLPFSLLRAADGDSLGSSHDVTYLPSITTLKWLRRAAGAAARNTSLAVFAAPLSSDSMAPLPYSRIEAETIAALLPKNAVWVATGSQASRGNVLATDWSRFTIAHFAAHAIVDVSRPEISGIALSTVDAAGHTQDGVLRMNDIYGLDMPVDLVVLSGCDTASGRDMDAEGVFSLSRAFFYAGAARVVASLWPVEDRATAAFMPEFYRALLVEHMSVASALRVAQQRLAQDSRWSSPYYWAGFVAQGDWN
jgi:tetratricopeptide (TPR) repeat protein